MHPLFAGKLRVVDGQHRWTILKQLCDSGHLRLRSSYRPLVLRLTRAMGAGTLSLYDGHKAEWKDLRAGNAVIIKADASVCARIAAGLSSSLMLGVLDITGIGTRERGPVRSS